MNKKPNILRFRQWILYVVRQRNYSIARILFYNHIEKKHRLVFDNLYVHDYRIKLKDKPLLIYYKSLCRIAPEFRGYLKYWKPVLKRAYYQKRINWKNLIVWQKLQKVNTERYSHYAA